MSVLFCSKIVQASNRVKLKLRRIRRSRPQQGLQKRTDPAGEVRSGRDDRQTNQIAPTCRDGMQT